MQEENTRRYVRAFGIDESGYLLLPPKMSNVKLSRIEHFEDRGGCAFCYPHGIETTNATLGKNKRSWKHHRKTQYRPGRV